MIFLNCNKDILNVAVYARVSTDKDDQANSFETQVKFFAEFIEKHKNWNLVKVYSDDGVTGTNTKKRIGLTSMIDDALEGKIDFIITKEVSRFARNTVDTLQITRDLKNKGVGVYFVLDNINTLDKDGELRLTLMASLAQEESRKTSERVKWGQKRQMEKGVVFGRNLLGYRVEKGKLYLIEDEAEIVKLIFHKYLNEGKGTHIIARELKEEGIKPCNPDGKAKYSNYWSSTVILRILRNEKYVGDLCQKKTYTKNFLDHKKSCNKGEEEMVYIKNHHPEIAIISREMWDLTQKELGRRTKVKNYQSKYSNRYWASGKIFCGICGEHFVIKIKNTSAGQSMAWSCLNHIKAKELRSVDCKMSEWASDRSLKNIVLYIINLLIENKEKLKEEIIKEISQIDNKDITNSENILQGKIEMLKQRKMKLIDMRVAEEISKDDFKSKNEQIETEILRLKKQLKGIGKNDYRQQDKTVDIAKEIDRILNFDSYDLDYVLSTVLQKITVYEGHIVVVKLKDIHFNFKVVYKSTGRLDTYRTEILSLEAV